jgi:replicative DNA helicase
MPNEASSKSGKPAKKSGDNPGSDLHQKVTYLPDIHRLLPQAPDAEQGVLSSFLLAPRDVGGRCVERLIKPEHFHLPAHAQIYETLVELWNANQPIDFITLTQILRDRKQLDQVGGSAFITHLFTFLPTAANVGYYIGILEEKFTLREIITVCTEFASRSYDEQDDVPSLLNDVEAKIFGIAQDRLAIKSIEELYNRRGGITGLPTGFTELDKMTDGLHPGEMVVIAARPSMGKTALAMNIAEHVALEAKQPVAVFSLEMSSSQLVQRLLCSRARVNLANVRNGFLQNSDFTALTAAASKLAESKMFIDDSHDLTILELKAKCRRMKAQHNIQAIFIDYLQLLRSSSRRAQDNRQLEIAEISSGVKGLAKELNVPIVVLAQLNRNPEGRTGEAKGRPRLSDLRESGSIEQDADLVGLLVREEYYADSDEEKEKTEGKATLIIAKQRNGPVGDVPLTFLKEHTRFENRARETETEE